MALPAKVLVANRGEIAVRIIASLRGLGIASVAVFHAADAGARHVREADEAVELFGATPVAAHLDIDQVISACTASGADAIHPGFGFLSENAAFARAVEDAGIVFVGPPPDVIAAMGDKLQAKRIAARAGVPILPGTDEAVGDVDVALAAAQAIGYPVLIKASAGGGGRGMRTAGDPDACREAFVRASAEAAASFGDGRVFIERLVRRPRHVEVQILADRHGTVIHLGERECSIQRRYQKVIEECPSPGIDADTRAAMTATAVALAREVGYVSAGTVELIVDEDGAFFFLEMNTRLQVEHPVTELVTGVDIVAEQLRVAAGERLSIAQDDLVMRGHAIECRIYAEDPADGFRPATGTLERLRLPAGPGIRVDHGLREGGRVSAAFDPMLAKVCVHAADRGAAIDACVRALAESVILGVRTNTAYLRRVIGHPAFAAGDTHTGFLAEHADALAAPPPTEEQVRALLAAALLLSPRTDRRHAVPEPLAGIGDWRP